MHVYAITEKGADPGDKLLGFEPTLRAAQAAGKKSPPIFRPDVLILLVDIATSKDSLMWLLNNPHQMTVGLMKEGAMRTWTLNRRGGLREIEKENK